MKLFVSGSCYFYFSFLVYLSFSVSSDSLFKEKRINFSRFNNNELLKSIKKQYPLVSVVSGETREVKDEIEVYSKKGGEENLI